ncbi:MAG: hypothetical protein O2840_04620 [bacterium]|nr:hypothetical protein [bacterium]
MGSETETVREPEGEGALQKFLTFFDDLSPKTHEPIGENEEYQYSFADLIFFLRKICASALATQNFVGGVEVEIELPEGEKAHVVYDLDHVVFEIPDQNQSIIFRQGGVAEVFPRNKMDVVGSQENLARLFDLLSGGVKVTKATALGENKQKEPGSEMENAAAVVAVGHEGSRVEKQGSGRWRVNRRHFLQLAAVMTGLFVAKPLFASGQHIELTDDQILNFILATQVPTERMLEHMMWHRMSGEDLAAHGKIPYREFLEETVAICRRALSSKKIKAALANDGSVLLVFNTISTHPSRVSQFQTEESPSPVTFDIVIQFSSVKPNETMILVSIDSDAARQLRFMVYGPEVVTTTPPPFANWTEAYRSFHDSQIDVSHIKSPRTEEWQVKYLSFKRK